MSRVPTHNHIVTLMLELLLEVLGRVDHGFFGNYCNEKVDQVNDLWRVICRTQHPALQVIVLVLSSVLGNHERDLARSHNPETKEAFLNYISLIQVPSTNSKDS